MKYFSTFNFQLSFISICLCYDTCIMIIIIILLLRYVNMTVWFKKETLRWKIFFSYRTLLANIKSVQIPSAWKHLLLRVFFQITLYSTGTLTTFYFLQNIVFSKLWYDLWYISTCFRGYWEKLFWMCVHWKDNFRWKITCLNMCILLLLSKMKNWYCLKLSPK